MCVKVTVVMSTFNGEKFLQEQIDSILLQEGVEVHLFIRDDGSTDSTVDIIKRNSSVHSNVEYIIGDNLGYANSFLSSLLLVGESEYYAFSDQDDLWQRDKLISAINMLGSDTYNVYASYMSMIDEHENYLGIKKFENFKCSIGSVLSRNRLAGCTMVFNKNLKEKIDLILPRIIEYNTFNYGHDGWILICAILCGGMVVLDKKPYILYRRHTEAVTSSYGGVRKRISRELKNFWNKEYRRIRISKFFLDLYNKNDYDIMDYNKNVLMQIYNYKNSLKIKRQLFFGKSINTNVLIVDIKNKIAVLFNRY